ncbi:MAG: hypothetical protein QME40_04050 [bacterium]|nr:hypothetical protein [bacterium]
MDEARFLQIAPMLSYIAIMVTILSTITAFLLYFRTLKQRKRYKKAKEEDTKEILSLIKEREGLIRERETLKEEIKERLEGLAKREGKVMMDLVDRYERTESQRREDIMNWLEYKAKMWQEQLEERMNQRLSSIHKKINELEKRIVELDGKDEVTNE